MLKKTAIHKFAIVGAGQGAPQNESDFSETGHPFIRAGHLEDLLAGIKKENDLPKVNNEIAKSYRLKLYQPGTIIFAKSGMSATKGRIYKLNSPCYVVSHLATLQIKENAYPEFVVNSLKYYSPTRLIKDPAYPSISRPEIEKFKIPYFDKIEDQIRIATVLSKAEELIKQRNESIVLLDELLKSTFLKMFGDPIKNDKGFDSDILENMVDENCPLTYGIVQPGVEYINGIPIVRPVDFTKRYIGLESLKKIDPKISNQFNRTILRGDEILMTVRGSVGDVAMALPELKGCNVTRGITPIWFKDVIEKLFMFELFSSKKFRERVDRLTMGIALRQINLSELRKIKIIKPPQPLQKEFVRIVKKVEVIKTEYTTSLNELENLYGSLSQRAFKGELNLSKLEIPCSQTEVELEEDDTVFARSVDEKESSELLKVQTEEERINILNKNLEDFYKNIPHSGAPAEIDNKLRQLDIELKERGEIPFWKEYVKYRVIKNKFTTSFSFDELWSELMKIPFDEPLKYEDVKQIIFDWLREEKPFLKQVFNKEKDKRQIELMINETA